MTNEINREVNGIIALVVMAVMLMCCGGFPLILMRNSSNNGDSLNSSSAIKARQERAYSKFQSGKRLSDGDVANLAGDPIDVSSSGEDSVPLLKLIFAVGLLFVFAAIIAMIYLFSQGKASP